MTVFILVQLLIDIFLVGLLAIILRRQEKAIQLAIDDKLSDVSSVIQSKLLALDEQALTIRKKAEERLVALSRLCDEATRIVNRLELQCSLAPSQEETELISAGKTVPSNREIPRVAALQKAGRYLDANLTIDLKSLLKDQLS
ncbi:MAG: hypothetical protein HY537_10190 [Deltaproteobacteria bacterium]|nr:hypothetical protein [Deltaproteobacteria bacterium]